MTIALLFDHTVRVYRATTAQDDYNEPVETWATVEEASASSNARPDQSWAGDLEDRGAGEEEARTRVWFLAAALNVGDRDVLDVTSGPETGKRYRVLSLTKPTNPYATHHVEAVAEEWEGSLT